MNPNVLGFVIGSALCGALFLIPAANAQQPLPANSIPYSRGPGITTWAGTTPGPNQIITTDGSSVPTGSSTLPVAALPALTGDVTSSAGSVATTLAAGSASVLNSGTLGTGRLTGLYTGITGTGTLVAGATGSGFTVALGTSTITGTVPSANVSGSYTGLTGTGTLTAGATGAGFTVALGTSTLTGTLPTANVSGAYSGLTGTGTLTTGATGAGFTVALGTSTVTGALPAANFPALTGNVTTSAGSLITTIAAGAVTNAMLAGGVDLATKVTGILPSTSFPALTGDVTTVAGLVATTIAAGAVTNAMLAGSINLATKVTGTLPSTSFPALTGNVTTSAGSVSTTIANSVITNAMLSPGTFSNITGLGTVTFGTLTGVSVTGLSNPSGASDAANKAYVDAAVTGNRALNPSKYATAAVLPNTPVYNNGTSGVGATLTRTGNGTLTVDGSVVNVNEIVLVKDQAAPAENGQYFLFNAGGGSSWVLKRCTAADCVVEFDNAATMLSGSFTHITSGSVNANTTYNLVATVATVGTDPATFVLTSSGVSGVASLGGQTGTLSCAASLSCSGATVAVASAGVTNTMLAGSIDLPTKVTGILPTTSFPVLTGDVTTSSGSVVTAIGASKVTNTMLAGSIDLPTKVTGILPTTSHPALSGDISTPSGSVVTTIGAAKVTNAMLFGGIDLVTKVTGILPTTSHPALSGDISTPSGSVVTTIGALKVTNAMLAGSIDLATKVSGILPTTSQPPLSGDISTPSGSVVTTIGTAKVLNTMLAGSITASKLVGTDIATVGTITSGVWHAGNIGIGIATFSTNLAVVGGAALGYGVSTSNSAAGYGVIIPANIAKATLSDMSSLTLLSSDALASNPLQMAISMAGNPTAASRYGYIQMTEYGTANYRVLAIQPSGGSLGVGTVVPVAKLQSQGVGSIGYHFYVTNADYVDASAGSGLALGLGASSGTTYSYIQALTVGRTSTGSLALNASGGNVGIGTTAPTTQLDTTGTVRFRNHPNGCLSASSTGVLSAIGCQPNVYFVDCAIGFYGAPGTDCTTAIQAAVDAAAAARGGTIMLPAGNLTVSCNGGTTGVVVSYGATMIKGQGWADYLGALSGSAAQRGDLGTYIYTSATGCTPFTFTSTATLSASGTSGLRDMAFYQNQPAESGGWTPTAYPATVVISPSAAARGLSGGQVELDNLMFFGVYWGVQIGNYIDDGSCNVVSHDCNYYASRTLVNNFFGDCIHYCFTIYASSDTAKFNNIHVWPYFSNGRTNTRLYINNNAAAFLSARNDNPLISNVFLYGLNMGFQFYQVGPNDKLVAYSTALMQITNIGFDSVNYPFYYDNAGSTQSTHVAISNMYHQCYGAGPFGSAGACNAWRALSPNNSIIANNVRLTNYNQYAVDLAGSGNDLSINNLIVTNCDANNDGSVALYVGPSNTITLSGRYVGSGGFCTGNTTPPGGLGTLNATHVN